MDALSLLLVAAVVGGLYLAAQSGALSQFGINLPGTPGAPGTITTATGETISGTPAAQITVGASALQAASIQGAQAVITGQQQSQQTQSRVIGTAVSAIGAGTATGVTLATTTTATITTAAMTAGITAGIGVVVGIALALWSAHEARIAGAQKEDAAWNEIMPGFISMMQGIVNAFNAGQIDKPTAAAEVLAAKQYTFSAAQKFVGTPGTDWTGGNIGSYQGHSVPIGLSTRTWWKAPCNKYCSIGCCLWNGVVGPACNRAMDIFTGTAPTSGQDVHIPSTSSSSYGYRGTPQQDLYLTR